jgi:hypothetical protein
MSKLGDIKSFEEFCQVAKERADERDEQEDQFDVEDMFKEYYMAGFEAAMEAMTKAKQPYTVAASHEVIKFLNEELVPWYEDGEFNEPPEYENGEQPNYDLAVEGNNTRH